MFAQLSLVTIDPYGRYCGGAITPLVPPHMPSSIQRAHVPPWADLVTRPAFVGGGMTLPTGEMHRTAASDLDEPTDGVDADLKFKGSLGTAVMLGIGMELGGGMQLGLEGSFIGHNFNEEDVTYNSTEYESEASATSLGAMITTAYQVDLNNQFSVTPMAGLGFFRNSGSGEIKFGTTTQEYDEHTRYGIGYAFGLGVGMALSDRSNIS